MKVHRRRTTRSCKFEGPLAKPVRIKFHGSPLAGGSPEEAQQLNFEERLRGLREWMSKFGLLFAHYELDSNHRDWAVLVMRMAVDLIPGFQVVSAEKPGVGHPVSPPFEDICLLVDTELVKQGLRSDGSADFNTKAAAVFKNEQPYKARWGHLSVLTLQNKLSEARRSRNPFAVQWRWKGELGQVAREGLIEMFGATRRNIFETASLQPVDQQA